MHILSLDDDTVTAVIRGVDDDDEDRWVAGQHRVSNRIFLTMMACKRLCCAVRACRPSAHIIGMHDICRSLTTLDWFLAIPGIDALVPKVPLVRSFYDEEREMIPTERLRRWLHLRRQKRDIPILFTLLEYGGDVADFGDLVALDGLGEGVWDDAMMQEHYLERIVLGGNLATISWALNHVHFSDAVKSSVRTARRAIDSGKVEVPTLLINRGYGGGFNTSEVQNYTLNTQVACGNIAMLQWAKSYWGIRPVRNVWGHALRGHYFPRGKSRETKRKHREVFRFLMDNGVPAPPRLIRTARVLQALFRGARARRGGSGQPPLFS